MNILSYLKKQKSTFAESPFNRVDALVLCWLAYLSFPDYLKGGESVALKDIRARGLLPEDKMYAEAYKPKTSRKFFKELTESERFKYAELCDFVSEKDDELEKQFAAVCIKISANEYFLAFRGTDPSFTGWKEDFNLVYRYPVPAQRAAAEYFAREAEKFPEAKFRLGGHSKGGNVAVYAAAHADKAARGRIKTVYNFDGPGFIGDVSADGVIKIVPNSSFVGALLEKQNNFGIIKSRTFGFLQHDPFSWTVKGCDFVYLKKRTHSSVRIERAVNRWIAELSIKERERVVELVYSALNTLDTKDFNVFFKTIYRQLPALYRQYRRLNAEDKTFFVLKIKRLQKLLVSK